NLTMHLGRVYPLLEFARGGRPDDAATLSARGTESVIATEAYVTVVNDWRSTLITSVTQNTLMSDTYPNPLNIAAGQTSPAVHLSASWWPGQSSFGLSFSPASGGAASMMNIDIGRPPAYHTDVSFAGSNPPGHVGAVLAPTKAFSSYDYNM